MLIPSNTQQKDYFGQIRCDQARQFYEKYYPDFKFFGYSLVDFSFYLNKGGRMSRLIIFHILFHFDKNIAT